MNLIDKDALVAEIERRLETIACALTENNRELSALRGAQQYELINLIRYIGTLEVKEVQEEPVGEELEEAANAYISNENNYAQSRTDTFKAGARWQKEQFEKNRLKHCNSINNEQAELEQGFIDQHLDKYRRMPTFLDAIEYGIRLQKAQMIKSVLDADKEVADEGKEE